MESHVRKRYRNRLAPVNRQPFIRGNEFMSIATRTGDNGTTGLMYNRRVSKAHPRMEANGSIDELNAAIGLARAHATDDWMRQELLATQKDLVVVMGELATLPEDRERYAKDGFPRFESGLTERLDGLVKHIEAQNVSFKGWATPGENVLSAALDLARTACRRAERRVCALEELGELPSGDLIVYFNRLSDVLWLMARWVETQATV